MATVVTEGLTVKELFNRDGFILSEPVIPADLIERVIPRMDALIEKEYATGIPPHARSWDENEPQQIRKIDQPQFADPTILELISHAALGELVAEVMQAKMIQVWAVQQLVKPPGGSILGHVGWHQDWQYWQKWWADGSEVFTVWVAVSDVYDSTCGPMKFIRGSHKWGFPDEGDFHGRDLAAQKKTIEEKTGKHGETVEAILKPGAVSFHHRWCYHASGGNTSPNPRRSFALHMRTEKSEPSPSDGSEQYYIQQLTDEKHSPIIYDSR